MDALEQAEQLIMLLEQSTIYGPADRVRETASRLYNTLQEAARGSRTGSPEIPDELNIRHFGVPLVKRNAE